MSIGSSELAILCLILFLLVVPVAAVGVVLLLVRTKGRTKPK